MRKLISKAALLLAAALALPTSANAVVVWDWSWSGTDIGSGSLTTNDLSAGSYLITEMTGTWNGADITLLPAGTEVESGAPIDNLLLDLPQQLNYAGLGFTTLSENVNLFFLVETYVVSTSLISVYRGGVFTATPVAAVPEPETYALMLAGLALVGAAAHRRRARA